MFVIIRDTREKRRKGWKWGKGNGCAGTVERTLQTGDYSVEGLEDFVVVERKGRTSEWAKNVTEQRFENELERLNLIPHSYILLEFTMEELARYPMGSGIPKYLLHKVRIGGKYILKRMEEMAAHYNISIVLCGKDGKEFAFDILATAYRKARGDDVVMP